MLSPMSIIYDATITPSKLDMIGAWLQDQQWFVPVDTLALERIASFRFDDPAGLVGIETLLIRSGATLYQVPVTYRGSPLDGAESYLLSTTEHSVLGTRWVYDATGDPLYAASMAGAVLAGEPQADQVQHRGEERIALPATISLASTGSAGAQVPAVGTIESRTEGNLTIITASGFTVAVVRKLGIDVEPPAGAALTGTWAAGRESALLATAAPTVPS